MWAGGNAFQPGTPRNPGETATLRSRKKWPKPTSLLAGTRNHLRRLGLRHAIDGQDHGQTDPQAPPSQSVSPSRSPPDFFHPFYPHMSPFPCFRDTSPTHSPVIRFQSLWRAFSRPFAFRATILACFDLGGSYGLPVLLGLRR